MSYLLKCSAFLLNVELGAPPENGAGCAGQVSGREWIPLGLLLMDCDPGLGILLRVELEQEMGQEPPSLCRYHSQLSATQSCFFGSCIVSGPSSEVTFRALGRPGTLEHDQTQTLLVMEVHGACAPLWESWTGLMSGASVRLHAFCLSKLEHLKYFSWKET